MPSSVGSHCEDPRSHKQALPCPRGPGLTCRCHLPYHTEFATFSLQGPAGKDGEAGAQGAPGPAVSVPVRKAWGAGKGGTLSPFPLDYS